MNNKETFYSAEELSADELLQIKERTQGSDLHPVETVIAHAEEVTGRKFRDSILPGAPQQARTYSLETKEDLARSIMQRVRALKV